MTHDEIVARLRILKRRMKWTNKDIETRCGVSYGTVRNLMAGENIGLYQFLDILDGMGLEINII